MQVRNGLLNLKKLIYEHQQNINQLVEISEEDAIKYGFINDSGNQSGNNDEPKDPDTPITPEEPDEIDYSNEYFTIKFLENSNLTFNFIPHSGDKLYYSFDKNNWDYLTNDNNKINNINANSFIYFKSNINPTPGVTYGVKRYEGIGTFNCSGKFNVSGNIMSLLYGEFFYNQKSLLNKKKAFYELFKNCTTLINAKNLILPAITLDESCYDSMFNGCRNLLTPPNILPAINLINGCYTYMFYNCNSLLYTPKLISPLLVNNCYNSMFNGCINLQKIYCLSNITLDNQIYAKGMFENISSSGIFIKQYNIENSILPLHWIIKEIEINNGNEIIVNEYINE